MRYAAILPAVLLGVALCGSARADSIITFDNLSHEPNVNDYSSIYNALGHSYTYDGVTFDANFEVVGKSYVEAYQNNGGNTPFADPHSGNYALFNASGKTGLLLTTNRTLYGAWFSRPNFGNGVGGAVAVTIEAFSGGTLLGSVSESLTSYTPKFLDTSIFATYRNITAYEVLRTGTGTGPYNGTHYIMDDLTFSPTKTPEPGASALVAASAMLSLGGIWRKRSRVRRA